MKPLSLTTRRIYAFISFAALIVVVPVALLYASGYRLDGFSLASTGGIFIATPAPDVVVSINGEERKRSGVFNRAFLIDNLRPGIYVVQADAPGHYPWSKNIFVEEGVVTDVAALLIEQPLSIRRIIRAASTAAATTTDTAREISAAAYDDIIEAFRPDDALRATPIPLGGNEIFEAALPEPTAVYRGHALFLEEGTIRISWERSLSSIPSHFCVKPFNCTESFIIEDWGETVLRAVFHRGGIVFQTKESGVFFTDIDVRPPRFIIPLYTKPGSEFRIVSGRVVVQDDGAFYEISGL